MISTGTPSGVGNLDAGRRRRGRDRGHRRAAQPGDRAAVIAAPTTRSSSGSAATSATTRDRRAVSCARARRSRARARASRRRCIGTAPIGPAAAGVSEHRGSRARSPTRRPGELIATVLEIERAARPRPRGEARWGPRTIDLDVLAVGRTRDPHAGARGAAPAACRAPVRARAARRSVRRGRSCCPGMTEPLRRCSAARR